LKRSIVIHRKITWLILFSVVSLGIASGFIYSGKENIEKSNSVINQTYETIEALQMAITSMFETGTVPADLLDSLEKVTRKNKDLQHALPTLREYIVSHKPANDTRQLLHYMLDEENQLLAARKNANILVNQHVATLLILGRVGAFLFVVIILLMVNKDITQHKTTQRKLIAAIAEAQQARKMQEQFLANMSHEIRTPMNGIKGMTVLLLETPLSDKQQDMAGMIKRSINTLLVVINDILDFSKIKAGKLHIEKIDLSIREVLNSTQSLFAHPLRSKGLQLQIAIDPKIPDCVTGDPHRLNQVLNNLLSNAIKFTNKGGIKIEVQGEERLAPSQPPPPAGGEELTAWVGERPETMIVRFKVTDTGVGIPEESIGYIFDSFSQAGLDTTRRFGGTGLGLTICKQLLQLQGGDISVTSTVGKGSTFEFYLPYGLTNKQAPEAPATTSTQEYNNLLAGKNVLVAEDNEINQKLIEFVLRKAGGAVTIASNGEEAVQYLQEDKTYHLIIMDLQMPKMDGYATTYYIRHQLRLTTPIIAMTATAMKDEQWQCLHAGMNEYMTKPFEFAELYKRIVQLVD